jgi:hypothetical protein
MKRLVKLLKYKDTCIKIYYVVEWEPFYYEYTFKQKGKIVKDRTSWTTIGQCIEQAKLDYDMEA